MTVTAIPADARAEKGARDSIYPYETQAGTRYYFVFRDRRGKQSTRRGFTSRTAARKAREELMGRVHRGEVRISRLTLKDLWTPWLERRKPYLVDGTWQDYRRHGELRILPHLGAARLATLNAPMLSDWLVELEATGDWAPKTLNNALKTLVVCLNQAVRDGLLSANPAAFVQALPLAHIERDYLRLHEISLYLDGCDAAYRPLAETLIGTGLRISEAIALTLGDVDLDRHAIVVYRSAKAREHVGATKGKRFRRVEIGPALCATLARQITRRLDAGAAIGDVVFVTPHRTGRAQPGRWDADVRTLPLDRNTISRGWHKAALGDAGLRDMPLHALRHTAAAAWLTAGQPLVYVQRQLGHAQITTTERIYGHLEETVLRSAAAETEERIRQAAEHYAGVAA